MDAEKAGSASPRSRRPYTSLRGHNAFRRVFRTGKRRRCGGVTVVVAAGPGPVPRVGVVAGRGVGAAVARNRAKRRIRAALAQAPLRSEADYVVIASPEVNEVEFRRLIAWLGEAMTGEGEM